MLRVKIDTDNDAFVGNGAEEVARLLRIIAKKIEGGALDGSVRDCNGNKCGSFDLRLEQEQE